MLVSNCASSSSFTDSSLPRVLFNSWICWVWVSISACSFSTAKSDSSLACVSSVILVSNCASSSSFTDSRSVWVWVNSWTCCIWTPISVCNLSMVESDSFLAWVSFSISSSWSRTCSGNEPKSTSSRSTWSDLEIRSLSIFSLAKSASSLAKVNCWIFSFCWSTISVNWLISRWSFPNSIRRSAAVFSGSRVNICSHISSASSIFPLAFCVSARRSKLFTSVSIPRLGISRLFGR